MMTLDDGTVRAEWRAPRFAWAAMPERVGMWVTVHPCTCLTCRQVGAHLTEPHHRITFDDGVSREHTPARYLGGAK